MDFEKRCQILAEAWFALREREEWADYIKYADISLPYAFGIHHGHIEKLSDVGVEVVEEAYKILMQALGIEDEEYEDFVAMVERSIELGNK